MNQLAVNLEQDYQWAGADEHGSARYAHRARVSGRLQRDPLSPIGSVWFNGSLDAGSISVDQSYSSAHALDTIQVTANGAPVSHPAAPLVYAFVNLQTCKLDFVGYVPARAQHVRTQSGGSYPMEATVSGLGFRIADYSLGGRRQFGQDRLLPALLGARDRPEFIDPDSHAEFPGVSGSARVGWSLVPQ